MHLSGREAKEDDELVSVIDILNNEQEADNFNSGRERFHPEETWTCKCTEYSLLHFEKIQQVFIQLCCILTGLTSAWQVLFGSQKGSLHTNSPIPHTIQASRQDGTCSPQQHPSSLS